jgi:hypothetical protein
LPNICGGHEKKLLKKPEKFLAHFRDFSYMGLFQNKTLIKGCRQIFHNIFATGASIFLLKFKLHLLCNILWSKTFVVLRLYIDKPTLRSLTSSNILKGGTECFV